MNKIVISVVFMGLTACTSNTNLGGNTFESDVNPRIQYKNLLEPFRTAEWPLTKTIEVDEIVLMGDSPTNSTDPISSVVVEDTNISPEKYFVSFYNESWVLPSDNPSALRELHENHGTDYHYFVVGHSHGKSLVGTAILAGRRAETTVAWMVENGINPDSIHQMAAWSSTGDSLSPPKGVVVYVTKEKQGGGFLLSLAPFNSKEEVGNEIKISDRS